MSHETDKAVPDSNKYTVYRFHVTVLYRNVYPPRDTWHTYDKHPVTRARHMTDILHCPNNGGLATCNIFDKQLATKGLSRLDMAAGCTDGGGENVGQDGIHEACRSVRPDYSQRRCFGHFPWTVVKAGLKELHSTGAIDNLNSYLTNDQSWQRLAAITTQGIMQGELALMLYGSAGVQTTCFLCTTEANRR